MKVFVYGATGFVGGLIARSLLDKGHDVVVAGRDAVRVAARAAELGVEHSCTVWVHDPLALREAMTGSDLVVSCAGPFATIGQAVLEAALAAGAHYVDTAEEQQFVRNTYERYESHARNTKRTVVNAMAFEAAMGDWAAADLARAMGTDAIDEIALYYGADDQDAGKLSADRAMQRRGWVWSVDRWQHQTPGAETRMVDFGSELGQRTTVSFPSCELITIPRHVSAHRVQSFISMFGSSPMARGFARMSAVLGPTLPALMATPLGALAGRRGPASYAAPSEAERRAATFALIAECRGGFHRERIAIRGADIYGLTVEIVGMAAEMIESGGAPTGVTTPAQLIPAEEALPALAERCQLTIEKSY